MEVHSNNLQVTSPAETRPTYHSRVWTRAGMLSTAKATHQSRYCGHSSNGERQDWALAFGHAVGGHA